MAERTARRAARLLRVRPTNEDLAGHVSFKQRVLRSTSRERPFALAALLLALPAAIVLPPLVALGGVVVILGALIAVESVRYADHRRGVRAWD